MHSSALTLPRSERILRQSREWFARPPFRYTECGRVIRHPRPPAESRSGLTLRILPEGCDRRAGGRALDGRSIPRPGADHDRLHDRMTALGQTRLSGTMLGSSVKPPKADIWRPVGNVAEVPLADSSVENPKY
jgi:hypothetical protein